MNTFQRSIHVVKSTALYSLASLLFVSIAYGGLHSIRTGTLDTSAGISLNQTIHNDRGARIHIQYGEVKAHGNQIRESEPYCYFRIHRPGSELRSPVDIQATTFNVVKIRSRSYQVNLTPSITENVQLAGFSGGGPGGEGGGANQLTLATEFHLNDPAQPHVKKLICAVFTDPRDRGHVNIDEIRETLGDLVNI